jgi:hypothetical protein
VLIEGGVCVPIFILVLKGRAQKIGNGEQRLIVLLLFAFSETKTETTDFFLATFAADHGIMVLLSLFIIRSG